MEIIDAVQAQFIEIGDNIIFDGSVCEVREIQDEITKIKFVSEDDREREENAETLVSIYGY